MFNKLLNIQGINFSNLFLTTVCKKNLSPIDIACLLFSQLKKPENASAKTIIFSLLMEKKLTINFRTRFADSYAKESNSFKNLITLLVKEIVDTGLNTIVNIPFSSLDFKNNPR